jgi:hypothetical protein
MGLSNSKPDSNGLDYKKLRSRHLSKEEIRQNIKVLLSNPQIGQYSDTQNTLDWITDSLNLNTTQTGGNSLSESENLKKLNNFIKNLENTEEEVSENFDLYKNEVMKLEKYINQNGGYDKFEGRPLNIIYSEYLNKLPIDKYDPDVDVDESDVSELQITKNNRIVLKGGDMSESSESTYVLTSDKKNMKELYDNEISTLENYIKQNGGYEAFEGRLLNIVNSKVLEKINYEEEDTETENSLSTINFTKQDGGCPCESQNEKQVFMKNTSQIGAGLNTISATSVNSINLKNNATLSATSNSSIVSGQKGGNNNTISATSQNSINLKNNAVLSTTSNSSKVSKNSKQNGGKHLSLNTLSETSLNSKVNINDLPRFSDTSFSENVLNGGAREENKERRDKKERKERKERRRKDESSTSTVESTDDEDVDLDESEDSDEETSSDDVMNDEDTESSDDTVKMARIIARQRLVSESADDSSSTTTDSEEDTSQVSTSDDTSETSDADTSTESADSKKMARSKAKKAKSAKKSTKKSSKKGSKGKKSKKMSRTVTENGLSESTEFRAVPFYSSENSTSFYRNYQNKNRFN